MPRIARIAAGVCGLGLGTLGYSTLIERNLFTLRRFQVPVLAPGARPITLLHISDLHLMPGQTRKRDWVRELALLQPDVVVNTGDHLSSSRAMPMLMKALEPLFEFPGVFVPGNNDYYEAFFKSPARYFDKQARTPQAPAMPWPQMSAAMQDAGWLDLTHRRQSVSVGPEATPIAFAGTDDPHLRRARYDLIAGPADPTAAVRIGVAHSPEPAILGAFAQDGYDLALAGHTHGGQVRVPFGTAITTNSGIDVHRARWLHRWDERMWFNVCAGLGTNPYFPIRFACRPEAALLTLVPR